MSSRILLSIAAIAALSVPLLAAEQTPPAVYVDECPEGTAAPGTANAGTADAWIVLDDASGTIRHATREQLRDIGIDPARNRSDEGLRMVVHEDGSRSVNLEGRFQSAMIVRLDGDSASVSCTDDPAAAAQLLRPEEK